MNIPEASIRNLVAVTRNLIYKHGHEVRNRNTLHPEIREAAQIILDALPATVRQKRLQPFTVELRVFPKKVSLRNVARARYFHTENVFTTLGAGKPRYLFCAHYDTSGHNEDDWNFRRPKAVPGADDNAAGVACLIELARVLAGEARLRGSVDLLFTSCEEYFKKGAIAFVAHLPQTDPGYDAVLVLDSFAFRRDKPLLGLFHNQEASQLAERIASLWSSTGSGGEIYRRVLHTSREIGSDFDVLRSMGAPALQVSEHSAMGDEIDGDVNSKFHTQGDTIDQLDFRVMKGVVDMLARFVMGE